MDILEIEKKETMSREEAAARLRAFADTLARNNDARDRTELVRPGSRRGYQSQGVSVPTSASSSR
jgi:hypothetical protein